MKNTFSIQETADMFGLSPSALRYYDKEGLLPGVERTAGGARRFTMQAIKALRVMECLKKSGLSIQQIQNFFALRGESEEVLSQRLKLFEAQRAAVQGEIAALQDTLEILEFKCWYYSTARRLGSEKAVQELPVQDIPQKLRRAKALLDAPPLETASK